MENYVVLDSNEKVFVPSQRKQSLRPLFTMKYFYYPTYLSSYCSEIAGLHFCSHIFQQISKYLNFSLHHTKTNKQSSVQMVVFVPRKLCKPSWQLSMPPSMLAHERDFIDLHRFVPNFTRTDLTQISKLLLNRLQSCFHLLFCTTQNCSTIQNQFKTNCTAPQSASYLNIPLNYTGGVKNTEKRLITEPDGYQ